MDVGITVGVVEEVSVVLPPQKAGEEADTSAVTGEAEVMLTGIQPSNVSRTLSDSLPSSAVATELAEVANAVMQAGKPHPLPALPAAIATPLQAPTPLPTVDEGASATVPTAHSMVVVVNETTSGQRDDGPAKASPSLTIADFGCKACLFGTRYGHHCQKKRPPRQSASHKRRLSTADVDTDDSTSSSYTSSRASAGAGGPATPKEGTAETTQRNGGNAREKEVKSDVGNASEAQAQKPSSKRSKKNGQTQVGRFHGKYGILPPGTAPSYDVRKYCGFCCLMDRAANLLRCSKCGNRYVLSVPKSLLVWSDICVSRFPSLSLPCINFIGFERTVQMADTKCMCCVVLGEICCAHQTGTICCSPFLITSQWAPRMSLDIRGYVCTVQGQCKVVVC